MAHYLFCLSIHDGAEVFITRAHGECTCKRGCPWSVQNETRDNCIIQLEDTKQKDIVGELHGESSNEVGESPQKLCGAAFQPESNKQCLTIGEQYPSRTGLLLIKFLKIQGRVKATVNRSVSPKSTVHYNASRHAVWNCCFLSPVANRSVSETTNVSDDNSFFMFLPAMVQQHTVFGRDRPPR